MAHSHLYLPTRTQRTHSTHRTRHGKPSSGSAKRRDDAERDLGLCEQQQVVSAPDITPVLTEVLVPRAFYAALTDSAVYKQYDWHFMRILGIRLLQILSPQLTYASYSHDLLPTTGSGVRKNCKRQKWPLSSHHLPGEGCADSTLHEIRLANTSPDAPVFLYFHGGGYRQPASPQAHVKMAHLFGTALNASAVYFLEYTLTPHGQFPSQLRQAAIALRYLLREGGFKPEQIVLGGDSAGGHLVLSLLAHLIQPHPDISAVREMEGHKLKGALCISPWVTMTINTDSFVKWDGIDMITRKMVVWFADLFAPDKSVYADMLEGSEEFWSQIPVQSILLTAGGIECLHDDILKMAERLQGAAKNGVDVTLVKSEGEIHVQIALDVALNLPASHSNVEMVKWLKGISD